jgi:hypothetical protein
MSLSQPQLVAAELEAAHGPVVCGGGGSVGWRLGHIATFLE